MREPGPYLEMLRLDVTSMKLFSSVMTKGKSETVKPILSRNDILKFS